MFHHIVNVFSMLCVLWIWLMWNNQDSSISVDRIYLVTIMFPWSCSNGMFYSHSRCCAPNNDCWFVISLAGCSFPTEELDILLRVVLSSKCLIHVIRLVALTEIFLIQQQWLRITSKQFFQTILRENVSFFWLPLMNGLFKLLYSHFFKIHF